MQGYYLLAVLLGALNCSVLAAPTDTTVTTNNKPLPSKSIEKAVKEIAISTANLDQYLEDGAITYFRAAKVWLKTKRVGKKINQGIQHANQSEPLNLVTGLKVVVAADELVLSVNSTMENLISHYYDFARLPLVPVIPIPGVAHLDSVVRKILIKQRRIAEEFGNAILNKVPAKARRDGQARLTKIYRSFDMAIEVYKNKKSAAELAAEDKSAAVLAAEEDTTIED